MKCEVGKCGEDPEMPLTSGRIYGQGTKSAKAMLVTLMIGLRWQMMIGSGGICRYEWFCLEFFW